MPQTPQPQVGAFALITPLSEMIEKTHQSRRPQALKNAAGVLAQQLCDAGILPGDPTQACHLPKPERAELLKTYIEGIIPQGIVKGIVISQEPIGRVVGDPSGTVHRAVINLESGRYFPELPMAAFSEYFGKYNPFRFMFTPLRQRPFEHPNFTPSCVDLR